MTFERETSMGSATHVVPKDKKVMRMLPPVVLAVKLAYAQVLNTGFAAAPVISPAHAAA